MPLSDTRNTWQDVVQVNGELEALQEAVRQARQDRWHGDRIEPEFETFLTALHPSPPYPGALPRSPGWQGHHNSWREALEQAG